MICSVFIYVKCNIYDYCQNIKNYQKEKGERNTLREKTIEMRKEERGIDKEGDKAGKREKERDKDGDRL